MFFRNFPENAKSYFTILTVFIIQGFINVKIFLIFREKRIIFLVGLNILISESVFNPENSGIIWIRNMNSFFVEICISI